MDRVISNRGALSYTPAYSPDGKRIAFAFDLFMSAEADGDFAWDGCSDCAGSFTSTRSSASADRPMNPAATPWSAAPPSSTPIQ